VFNPLFIAPLAAADITAPGWFMRFDGSPYPQQLLLLSFPPTTSPFLSSNYFSFSLQ
jgi:hypothetical protein